MQFEQDNDTYIIYLEKDERIMNGLTQFCKDHKISNGKIGQDKITSIVHHLYGELGILKLCSCLLYTYKRKRD